MSTDDRIRISERNRRRLRELMRGSDSYDDVITQLLQEHNRRRLFERMNEADENPEAFVPLRKLDDE